MGMALIPGMVRKKDTAYVVLPTIEGVVLVVAASGILGSADINSTYTDNFCYNVCVHYAETSHI
jgi:hypothetical protein